MKHSEEMLLWGLRNGEMHFIDDVENGIECNCICPHCSERLIARNDGQLRTHSFAHRSGADCSMAVESAVHKLAKQVLAQTKNLRIPSCFGPSPRGLKEYIPGATIHFDEVELEKTIIVNGHCIRPDAVAKFGEKELYIEFLFTHSVDDDKTNIIRQKKVSCLEITLHTELQEPGRMKTFLEESIESKEWIYHKALQRLMDEEFSKGKDRQKEKSKQHAEKQRRLALQQKAQEAKRQKYLLKLEWIRNKVLQEENDWLAHAKTVGNIYTTCPAQGEFLSHFRQSYWGNNELIQMLETGDWFGRKIFNNWPNEPIDIFLNREHIILRPKKSEYDKLAEGEKHFYNYLLQSVVKYSKLTSYQVDVCSHCRMFIERKYEHILCKYQRGMDIAKCIDLDSNWFQ